jgi:DNA-binding NarL/FixJ family response regulator
LQEKIRVGLVDDHAIVRAGLQQFFADLGDIEVVGEADSGRAAIDLVRSCEMDVLLMDLSMPGQTGLDALTMIRAKAPQIKVLVLSSYPEEHYAQHLLRLGAKGYLNKQCEPEEIATALRAVAQGQSYLSSRMQALQAQQAGLPDQRPPHELLSDREFQVFLRLAKGQGVGQIGEDLSLSVKTVSTYRTRLLEKMHLSSNSDLTYYALKNQLLD